MATRCPLQQQLQCGFCVADGLYHQRDSEFRVASSVEQLNMEVGTYLNTKAKGVGTGLGAGYRRTALWVPT